MRGHNALPNRTREKTRAKFARVLVLVARSFAESTRSFSMEHRRPSTPTGGAVDPERSCGIPRECGVMPTFELSPGRYSLLIVYAAASLMAALVWNIMVLTGRLILISVCSPQQYSVNLIEFACLNCVGACVCNC